MKRRRRKRRTASRGAKTPLQSAICCLETTCRTPSPPPPLPPRLPPLPRLKLPRPPSCARHSAHPPSPCPVAARLRCRRRPPLFTLHHPPMPPAAVKASSILARLRHCTEVKASSILARCSPRHASKPPPPPPPTPTPPPPTPPTRPPPLPLLPEPSISLPELSISLPEPSISLPELSISPLSPERQASPSGAAPRQPRCRRCRTVGCRTFRRSVRP